MSFRLTLSFAIAVVFYSSCSFTTEKKEMIQQDESSTEDDREKASYAVRMESDVNPFLNVKHKRHDFGINDRDPFLITYDHSDLNSEQKDSIYGRFNIVFRELLSPEYLFGGIQVVQGSNRVGDTISFFKKEYFSAIGLNKDGVPFDDIQQFSV